MALIRFLCVLFFLSFVFRNSASVKVLKSASISSGTANADYAQAPAVSFQARSWFINLIDGFKNGCASGLASACAKTILQPLDTIKTVQQANQVGMFAAGSQVMQRGGFKALYSGLGVTVVGSAPSSAVYFGTYHCCRRWFDGLGLQKSVSILASAGIGNTVASCLRAPYELVKQRLQYGMYPNTWTALTSIVRDEGVQGFFMSSGLKIQMARDIPYAMMTLLVYETLQDYVKKKHPRLLENGKKVWVDLAIGGIAGGVGTWMTNPMDVVKTRIMTAAVGPQGPPLVTTTANKILAEEGLLGFYRGAVPRLLHRIPANAVFFPFYECFRDLLGIKR